MNPDAKRRMVMSLVSLALAFGLLAAYYIVTSPWNRQAVGRSLGAGVLFAVVSLAIQFFPGRGRRVPAAASGPVEDAIQPRPWNPERHFDLEGTIDELVFEPRANPKVVSLAPPPTPAAIVLLMAQHGINPVALPPKSPPVPRKPPPAELPPPAPVDSKPFERVIENSSEAPNADIVRIQHLVEPEPIRGVRNDDVLLEQRSPQSTYPLPWPPVALEGSQQRASAPSPTIAPDVVSMNGKKPKTDARERTVVTEFQKPDPSAPPELLHDLAEYWHVKYESERKRRQALLTKYEEASKRILRLEGLSVAESSELMGNGNGNGQYGVRNGNGQHADANGNGQNGEAKRVFTLLVEDGEPVDEDRLDEQTAQLERFH